MIKSYSPSAPVLAIVIPCYNESEVLPNTVQRIKRVIDNLLQKKLVLKESFVCFVNDGSSDGTWEIIEESCEKNPLWQGISLSRNFGHQSALLAGMFSVKADVYVTIDADLQDDEEKIVEMLQLYHEGKEIVYGCRDNRESDSFFKRRTAEMFYRLREILGIKTIPNHADFRLMSAATVEVLKGFEEVNLYLRGIIPMLGFPSACVYYSRKSRTLGVSKYPFLKMIQLAWNGVVNFTDIPLKCAVYCGFLGILFSVFIACWCLFAWYTKQSVPGWTSVVLVISLFGSCQLLCLGFIGLYISKIFDETKRRPRFIIQNMISKKGI